MSQLVLVEATALVSGQQYLKSCTVIGQLTTASHQRSVMGIRSVLQSGRLHVQFSQSSRAACKITHLLLCRWFVGLLWKLLPSAPGLEGVQQVQGGSALKVGRGGRTADWKDGTPRKSGLCSPASHLYDRPYPVQSNCRTSSPISH